MEDGKFTLISDSYNYKHHELAARQMEVAFDHAPVKGVFTGRDRDPETGRCLDERPVAKLHHHEWQQAERIKTEKPSKDPGVIKAELVQEWQQTDSGAAFKAALEQAGYTLAQGDKRPIHMVVDANGEAYDLRRSLPGVKKRELEVRLSNAPANTLPTVSEVRAQLDHEQGWFEWGERDERLQVAAKETTRQNTAWASEQAKQRQHDERERDHLRAWDQLESREADLHARARQAVTDDLSQTREIEAERHRDEPAREQARATTRREAFQAQMAQMQRHKPRQVKVPQVVKTSQEDRQKADSPRPVRAERQGALTRMLQRMQAAWKRIKQQDDHLQGLQAQAERDHELDSRAVAHTATRTAWARAMETERTEMADRAAKANHIDRAPQRDNQPAEAPRQPDRVPEQARQDHQDTATPPSSHRDQPSTDLVARGHAVVRERLEAARDALEQRTGVELIT